MPILTEFPIPRPFRAMRDDARGPRAAEGFFQDLSAEAQSEFQSLATDFRCSGLTVLISEADEPSSILFLLEGEVNISMNSSDGRRFLLGVAGAGDILGLTSAISGDSSEFGCKRCTHAESHRCDAGIFSGFSRAIRSPVKMWHANYAWNSREPAKDCEFSASHRPQWRELPIYCWSGAKWASEYGMVSRSAAR